MIMSDIDAHRVEYFEKLIVSNEALVLSIIVHEQIGKLFDLWLSQVMRHALILVVRKQRQIILTSID